MDRINNKFFFILKNIKIERFLHNISMLFFGLLLEMKSWESLFFLDCYLIIFIVISFLFYWISVILRDDIFDEKIDEISNPERLIVSGIISKKRALFLSNIFLFISFIIAFVVSRIFFIIILIRFLLSYLYSVPPFRLKRIPVIATFVLSLANISMIIAGIFLIQKENYEIPWFLLIFILFIFTLGFTAKDIKDYEGDKIGDIRTIPVIFGIKKAKKIIGFFVLSIFFLLPFFFYSFINKIILPSILAGILSFIFINKERYSEKPLFLIYFLYGLIFVSIVFNN